MLEKKKIFKKSTLINILNKTLTFVLMCRGVSFKDTRDKLANWQIETIEARLRTSSLNNWLMVIANIAFSHLCFAPYLPEPAHVCYTFIKDMMEVHSSLVPLFFFNYCQTIFGHSFLHVKVKLLEENLNILVKPSKHCKNELENMYIRVSQIDVQGVHNSQVMQIG